MHIIMYIYAYAHFFLLISMEINKHKFSKLLLNICKIENKNVAFDLHVLAIFSVCVNPSPIIYIKKWIVFHNIFLNVT